MWRDSRLFKWRFTPFSKGGIDYEIAKIHWCFVPSLIDFCRLQKKIFISSMYFRSFVFISPLKRVWPFINTWIPFTQGFCVPSLVENGHVVLENIFKISLKYFRNFVIISSLKSSLLLFQQIWIPLSQECFVLCLVEIGPFVLEKKMKMSIVYRQTDRQKDDGSQAIRKADELSAQAS